ncbi:hypothetical protein GOP47_0010338 [Adiantum capillus-veneris]|uniref:Uncharacterized protein n=1 Tax=Adiantum capillus-veneris TaxID=13818 RepID=A0A9D4ZHP1_ADICA|nr:hypothetical protein GOP47_0010338 [Adiantum capillus-veneris]
MFCKTPTGLFPLKDISIESVAWFPSGEDFWCKPWFLPGFLTRSTCGLFGCAANFLCTLRVCSDTGAIEQGKDIHLQTVESGVDFVLSIGTSLIDMYFKCGDLKTAYSIVNRQQSETYRDPHSYAIEMGLELDTENLGRQNVVTWSALTAGYVQRRFRICLCLCISKAWHQTRSLRCMFWDASIAAGMHINSSIAAADFIMSALNYMYNKYEIQDFNSWFSQYYA